MIIIFGASSDIGRRLTERLHAAGLPCRTVSRSMPGAVFADLQTGIGVEAAISGAEVVVSCAHARFTQALIAAISSDVRLVLVGSAWRYSRVPNERADQVRTAEALFLDSAHRGVMLHPTMIYGGNQENNLRRLMRMIRKLPVILAPGGGRQIVCPIYIDDLVNCLLAATSKNWTGRNVIGTPGPSLTWRHMAEISARSIGLRRCTISLPIGPTVAMLEFSKMLGFDFLDPNILRRFRENIDISTDPMRDILGVSPRSFEHGIIDAVTAWRL